ncbi:leucine Rich repeat-containing domain protein [Teladorsagia circumcincta]|uniref:Leucine Rich repeat-containing domain protein n=1 Tax=Teladorsagia circumcincta TaxID=45464 RepID=A0A2G9UVF6_TELCI|nr:leucine Rich repeat-containing domain protein [Teladorsagia circumcincta]
MQFIGVIHLSDFVDFEAICDDENPSSSGRKHVGFISDDFKKSLYYPPSPNTSMVRIEVVLNVSSNWISNLPFTDASCVANQLIIVDFSHNRLENLGAELHVLPSVRQLSLSHNRLSSTEKDSLLKCPLLQQLELNNNFLEDIQSLPGEIDLSHNRLTEVPIAIARLFKLKKIDLSHNKIKKLPQFVFNKISHLHNIDLNHNELSSVSPYVFSDCAHLNSLNLSHNHISQLFHDSLTKCPQLKRIDLSDNRLASLADALAQASAVRRLDVSRNHLELLQWSELPPRLEHLIADSNIITLLGAALKSKVRTVSLRGNRIEQLSADQIPDTIETLDLTANRIQHVAPATFASKTAMRSLDLRDNHLTELSEESVVADGVHSIDVSLHGNPLRCSCEFHWIKKPEVVKRKVNIVGMSETLCVHPVNGKVIALDAVDTKDLLCNYSQVCEPECVCCQFGNCDCKAVCPAGCACFRDALFETNVVRCENLTGSEMKVFTPAAVPISATHVYLSGLSLPILRSHSFLGRPRLEVLHINASGIRGIQPKAFNTLPKLKLLDLSDNAIVRLSGDEFHKSAAISHLFLNGNRLQTIERGLIDKLPALTTAAGRRGICTVSLAP